MTKEELESTGLHRMVDGRVVPMVGSHPSVNTCGRTIDHRIATRGVAEVCGHAEVLAEHDSPVLASEGQFKAGQT